MLYPTLLSPALRLSREAISWRSLSRRVVEIAVDVVNGADEPVAPGDLEIAAAPLGAFVPPAPIARVVVGTLEPGERRVITARVDRGQLPAPPTGMGRLFAHLTGMDAEFVELLDRAEWDGNIHVNFTGGEPVEVHRALDIAVQAGQTTAATLFTGPQAVELAVDVRSKEEWQAKTAKMPGLALLVVTAPEVVSRAQIVVNVTQPGSGRTVAVEFEFVAI